MEDGGRLGAHAQTLLRALTTSALSKGRTPSIARRMADAPHPMHVCMWVRLSQQCLFAWIHLALSRHAMRLQCLVVAAWLQYII